MRLIFIVLLLVCLACFFPVYSQSVIESKSNITFFERQAEISLAIANNNRSFNRKISIELIDEKGLTRAKESQNLKIKKGEKSYKIFLPLENLSSSSNKNVIWYRLKYSISGDDGKVLSTGIISISELVRDIFELRASASREVSSGQNYRVRVRAIHPITGVAIRDVKVNGILELDLDTDEDEDELKLKAEGETNKEGFAVLDFNIPADAKLDYDGDLKITGEKYGIVREVNEDLDTIEKDGSVFLTVDKPLYQPGQTFNVRALYFDSSDFVMANSELEFKIKDEEGTLLYRETVNTSEFGIASISWQIPENAKLGDYRVIVEADEDIYEDQLTFKVTRYDLPNFTVKTETDKSFYLPEEKQAEITVRADYLFGKPVSKGKVRVVQESDRRWNWREQKYDIDEKKAFEGETDSEGKFVAKVDLSEEIAKLLRRDWKRFEDLNFAAYFTDSTTNKTEQRRFDLRITKEPIHVYYIGNTYNLSQQLPIVAYVSTFYADGTPAVCDVKVEGKNDDEPDKFKTLQTLETNRLGAGKLRFMRPAFEDESDDLDLKIMARDRQGRIGTHDDTINYYRKNEGINIETDKAIYKPGEKIKVKLQSSQKDALVYVDVVENWSVIDSHFIRLRDGKGDLKIPYRQNFKGELVIAAYSEIIDEDGDLELIRKTRGIIFPKQQNLNLDATFSAASYKPNEEAKVDFSVSNGNGESVESALGVVVFDKAIEERARTDAEFGSYFSRFFGWLGYEKSFGGITLKNLNDLDLSKSISDELQLAAEVMLSNNYYYSQISRSETDYDEAKEIYSEYFKQQFEPISKTLQEQYEKNFEHPTDEISLGLILRRNGINFENIRDPWGQNYRVAYGIDRTQNILSLETAGADKKFDTKDDFIVLRKSFSYFTPTGNKIDKAVKDYHEETGKFIRDYETLKSELAKQDFDLDELKDRWGNKYQITFGVAGRNYTVVLESAGANGYHQSNNYGSDDFNVWTSRIDYFVETEKRINEIFSKTVNAGKKDFPKDGEEFKKLLRSNGLNFYEIRDGYGKPAYLFYSSQYRYADKTVIENGKKKITPVTEEVATFAIRSNGAESSYRDDFDLLKITGVISERSKETKYEKTETKTIAYSGANGAIRGTVTDANGAVVPGATVKATNNDDSSVTFEATTNDDGAFLIENIPSGNYSVRVDAFGFKSSVMSSIQVRAKSLVEFNVALEIGDVASVVEVTVNAGAVTVDTTSTKIDSNITKETIDGLPKGVNFADLTEAEKKEILAKQQTSTPRLREYFPETLVWNPEIITDKNGKAELKFKMADNITTWKLYTIASTKNGKIGVAEKEVQAFQPFFVDLEPPKFLTQGDEIYLPTQIRNYTASNQKVNVTMAKSDWFSFLKAETRTSVSVQDSATQQIEVASNETENAVFGFRADRFIKDGKQKVTAIAETDSDAIEKPVTVRPDGQEIVQTESKLFREKAEFAVNFPANALANTPKAELKIYPNLFAHVSESVEGLLQRPYGCGEQTISSTYPNVMILKFTKEENKLRQTAQKFLQKGYERLLGYQVASGGFSYWGGKEEADIALTAYALRFLNDAKEFIAVDEALLRKAENWLISQQRADGSWTRKYSWENSENPNRTKMLTSYVAKTFASLKAKDNQASNEREVSLQNALSYLKVRNEEIDEPYSLALFGLASLDAGNTADAQVIAGKLSGMAIPEGNAVYWKLETNTPFYGWGRAGRIETTALVVNLLTRVAREDQNANYENLVSKGVQFLLKNKDRYGVWYSTQTTINVLDSFLVNLANDSKTSAENSKRIAEIFINGQKMKEVELPALNVLATPVNLDLSSLLTLNANAVEIKINDSSSVMAQVVQEHYIDWQTAEVSNENTNESRQIRLDYACDKLNAEILQEVNCEVKAERVGFRGYGMLLAEIGVPPGADVSRESLQAALDSNWSLSRYDVLPDRIIVYLWATAGGTKFNFKFKPRYGINAQTPASVVYDYYNSEAKATVAPMRFIVK